METNEIVENEEEIAEVTEDVVRNCKKSSKICAGYIGIGLAVGITIPIVYRRFVQPLIAKIEDRREVKRAVRNAGSYEAVYEEEADYTEPDD